MYRYFVGDTRGWIEVRKTELLKANVLDFISTSSCEKGDFIYIDEDMDLSFFLYNLGEISSMQKIQVNDNYFKTYKRYEGGLQ